MRMQRIQNYVSARNRDRNKGKKTNRILGTIRFGHRSFVAARRRRSLLAVGHHFLDGGLAVGDFERWHPFEQGGSQMIVFRKQLRILGSALLQLHLQITREHLHNLSDIAAEIRRERLKGLRLSNFGRFRSDDTTGKNTHLTRVLNLELNFINEFIVYCFVIIVFSGDHINF